MKWLIIITVHDKSNGESISIVLSKIKNGDKRLKEEFISDYIPFIKKILSRTISPKFDIYSCDEYSISLIAFNDAIDAYDESKKQKFITFAELIIKRRIIDWQRLSAKRNNILPFTYFESEDGDLKFEETHSVESIKSQSDKLELLYEIKEYRNVLESFGININELPQYAPKHKDARKSALKIAKCLASDKKLFNKLLKTKNIPMNGLSELIDVHPKTVKRNRKFIIAASLIIGMDFDLLKNFVSEGEKD